MLWKESIFFSYGSWAWKQSLNTQRIKWGQTCNSTWLLPSEASTATHCFVSVKAVWETAVGSYFALNRSLQAQVGCSLGFSLKLFPKGKVGSFNRMDWIYRWGKSCFTYKSLIRHCCAAETAHPASVQAWAARFPFARGLRLVLRGGKQHWVLHSSYRTGAFPSVSLQGSEQELRKLCQYLPGSGRDYPQFPGEDGMSCRCMAGMLPVEPPLRRSTGWVRAVHNTPTNPHCSIKAFSFLPCAVPLGSFHCVWG